MGLSQRLQSPRALARESRIKNHVGVLERPLNRQPPESPAIGEKRSQKGSALKCHELKKRLNISVKKVAVPETVMSIEDQNQFFKAVYATHNGVFRMSPSIENLVETSNNIAKIAVNNGIIKIECLTRSSVDSSKENMVNTLSSVFDLAGFTVSFSGDYPGWAPNMDSAILKVVATLYEKINGEKANIAACHAGLECGILGTNYPEMDMISFGPTIKGAHSPDERASISSTQKFWKFIKEILKEIPFK